MAVRLPVVLHYQSCSSIHLSDGFRRRLHQHLSLKSSGNGEILHGGIGHPSAMVIASKKHFPYTFQTTRYGHDPVNSENFYPFHFSTRASPQEGVRVLFVVDCYALNYPVWADSWYTVCVHLSRASQNFIDHADYMQIKQAPHIALPTGIQDVL